MWVSEGYISVGCTVLATPPWGLLRLQESWSEQRRFEPAPSALLNRTRKRVQPLAIGMVLPLVSVRKTSAGGGSSMLSESSGITRRPTYEMSFPATASVRGENSEVDLANASMVMIFPASIELARPIRFSCSRTDFDR